MLGQYYQASDYISRVRGLIHDPSGSDYTDAQILTFVNDSRTRTAQDLRCVRQFITGLNTISQQEIYPLNGFTGGVIVTNGGQNYSANTTALFTNASSDATGTGAAAQVVVSNGVITNILMTNWGGGYTATPTLTLQNVGSGSGAAFNVISGIAIHDILTMTALWNTPGPTSSLAVTFNWMPFSGFQAYCRSYRGMFSNPGVYAVHYGTTSPVIQTGDARAFYMYPIPNQPYPLEMDVAVLPNALATTTSVDYQVIAPWNDAVQFYAAHLAYLGLQQTQLADGMLTIYTGRCKQLPATGYRRRIQNMYLTYARMARRSG